MTTRSPPALPTVTGAVRALPFASLHFARRWPLRMMISAPAGSGFVNVFLNTVPTVHLPFPALALALGGLLLRRRCIRHREHVEGDAQRGRQALGIRQQRVAFALFVVSD